MRPLSPGERKFVKDRLMKQYGVTDAFKGLVLLKCGRGRIRAATEEAASLATRLKRVQQVGLYVMKIANGDISLSIEGSQLLNGDIKKNVIELGEREAEDWMRAAPIKAEIGFGEKYVVGKCGKLYLGSARASRDGKLYPQVAKWRRLP